MNFKVGDTVRINGGQYYGQVGRVIAVAPDSDTLVRLSTGTEVCVYAGNLIDSHQNNGD